LKKSIYILFVVVFFYACNTKKQDTSDAVTLTSYVNPFIGTDGPGNTYPGATVPFGMVQLSPDIGIPGWDRIAGYFYQDSIISGFSHTHLTGTGAGDMYDILVMPSNSRFSKRIEANNFRPFSAFSHDKEQASPGYYTVDLLDLGYSLNWDKPTDTYFKVVDTKTIEGYRMSTGWASDQRLFFVIKLSKPFQSFKLLKDNEEVSSPVKGTNTKLILNYNTSEGEKIVLKTGLSTGSIKGAYKSLEVEAPDFNFDAVKEKADQLWEDELQKIVIETEDEEKKSVFYTMMYQSMLAPTLLSDVNGDYKGANDSIMTANGYDRYDTFSLWDTYRGAHPLHTILHPNRVSDMINSLLAHYEETGLLPVWSMQGNETNMMIGYHAVPVIVDAYFKGVKDFDVELAYKACKESAMDTTRQINAYMKYGYVPIDEHHENWSVSKTLEYAYDDWCIAQFAKDLGKDEDFTYFSKRAENWRNVYDDQSTFMRPKFDNGKFIKDFIPKVYTPYFCESNAWQYVWSVPQNIEGLVTAFGGEDAFEKKLDSMFSYYPTPDDKLPIFSTGMIGQYAHGNEPSHHVGYLYNYIGKPWKTQEKIRQILETQYRNEPNGHCGNEDCGQMSSWYILSGLGFYPVNPAQSAYSFGSPLFDKATINLENGNTFTIESLNVNAANKYIQSIALNGKIIKESYIAHGDIMKGGVLTFTMTDQPNILDKRIMISSSQVIK